MATVLGIDTTGSESSAALWTFPDTIIAEASASGGASETLLHLVSEVLDAGSLSLSDLDCIAAACGPGSFTGIRTGMACAQGLAAGTAQAMLFAAPVFEARSLWKLRQETVPRSMLFSLSAHREECFAAELSWSPGTPAKLARSSEVRCISKQQAQEEGAAALDDIKRLSGRCGAAWAAALGGLFMSGRLQLDEDLAGRYEPEYVKPVNALTIAERRAKAGED